jgi:hypothetical protein
VEILMAVVAGYVLLLAFLLINQARIGNLGYFWHRYGWGVLLHAPGYPFVLLSLWRRQRAVKRENERKAPRRNHPTHLLVETEDGRRESVWIDKEGKPYPPGTIDPVEGRRK